MEQPWERNGRCFCKHRHGQKRKSNIESELHQTAFWKSYIDDLLSLLDKSRQQKESSVEKANDFLSTIKLTAEMSEAEISFLDTKVYKGVKFDEESILDGQTHYKPTETFEYMNFYSCYPPDVKKGFIKGMLKEKRSGC